MLYWRSTLALSVNLACPFLALLTLFHNAWWLARLNCASCWVSHFSGTWKIWDMSVFIRCIIISPCLLSLPSPFAPSSNAVWNTCDGSQVEWTQELHCSAYGAWCHMKGAHKRQAYKRLLDVCAAVFAVMQHGRLHQPPDWYLYKVLDHMHSFRTLSIVNV